MKISKYIKEKGYLLILSILFSIVAFLFLYATQVQQPVIVMLLILYWMIIIASLIIEYARRAPFYLQLSETLNELDQKYLITEMINEPEFADGRELFDCLQEVNKSMIDHVNSYKYAQQDYKEYIEMWVHEIKTPLAAAHLILTNNPSPANASLEEEIAKVEEYVEQALYYARSNNTEKDYMIKRLELQPVVSKVIKRHSKSFIYKKIKVVMIQLDVMVYSDSKWLEFILHQILANALTYTPSEGTITLSTEVFPNKIILSVQDSGCGIRSEDLSRVFEKGFTGHNGRTNQKSTGMGLYLCKKLCEKLNLDITIQSDKQGTCVKIVFPISDMMLLK
ncbi:MAG: sensor histidine kinase [Erysipelotrichaceae bacterium]|uniref:histidine kinase n=1 Tax=Copranaerobaculum intestinale TaxID=2692629 RepID=A0A6N8U4K3_9FIRM|nr:sensor histidine kinase [Copranaerobaculum intestinale]MBS6374441.1 sensor histidine kinase [Erysipelotrichaceae bacterium]MXQ72445.1 sensor histidine kinase [Copranaerobaculum intestinale]